MANGKDSDQLRAVKESLDRVLDLAVSGDFLGRIERLQFLREADHK